MKININHPSFISYLDDTTNSIMTVVSLKNYFLLNSDAKIGVQFIVYKLIDSSLKVRMTFEDEDMKNFITILKKRNDENENYELSAVLKDLTSNFDLINTKNKTKPVKAVRKVKNDSVD